MRRLTIERGRQIEQELRALGESDTAAKMAAPTIYRLLTTKGETTYRPTHGKPVLFEHWRLRWARTQQRYVSPGDKKMPEMIWYDYPIVQPYHLELLPW